MKEYTAIWEQIENYLSNAMQYQEKEAFEKLLASDPDLLIMLDSYKLTEEVVVLHETSKLKEKMAADFARSGKGSKKWAWGLIIAGLAGAGLYFYQLNTKTTAVNKPGTAPFIKSKQENKPVLAVQETGTEIRKKVSEENKVLKKIPVKEAPVETTFSPFIQQENKSVESYSLKEEVPQNRIQLLTDTFELKDPCENLYINADFYTISTCKGKSRGELHVKSKSLTGGKPPYTYSLSSSFISEELINLGEGNYELYIKDGNGCIVKSAKAVSIQAVHCQETSGNYTFNPLYDPAWTVPYNHLKKATRLRIMDKTGFEILNIPVTDSYPGEWNGESNTGSSVPSGYYLYYIEYLNGTTDKGAITILR